MTDTPPSPPGDRLDQFAAQVAHDFNNLLTGVLGNLELLEYRAKRNAAPGLDEYLQGARSAGLRAAAFAQRLLLFSGRGARVPEPVPVAQLLSGAIAQLGALQVPVTLGAVCGAAALCDPGQAQQAVVELLDNAVRAAGGGVVADAQADAGTVSIRVRDPGPGMAPDVLARAMEPFFTTQSNGAGKGLGLAIAARFAARAGGALEIESQEGEGCTATLTLPRAT